MHAERYLQILRKIITGVSNLSKKVRNIIAAVAVVLFFTALLIVVLLNYKNRIDRDNAWVFSGTSESQESSVVILADINNAQADELMKIIGVGRTVAYDIVKFRNDLGGFSSMEQLKEIPSVDGDVYDILCRYYSVNNENGINNGETKINLNTATVRDLAMVDGISESTAKEIILYRKKFGDFVSVRELLEVNGIGIETYEKIKDKFTV